MKLEKLKSKRGITLIALAITITVLLIIAGISVYSGKEIIEKAKLESLKTNMLLIQAKSREYVEEVNFKMGVNPDTKSEEEKQQIREEVYGSANENGAKLEKVSASDVPSQFGNLDVSTCYWLTQESIEKWGLDKITLKENERYLIQFDEVNETVEVYNTIGFDNKYKLSEINNIEI